MLRGCFRPGGRQPIWFSEPQFFLDNGGMPISRGDLALYRSVTTTDDGIVLWYPDRKFFLLGREIQRSDLQLIPVI